MSLERINRKLAIIQALLVDLAEDIAFILGDKGEKKPVAEKHVRKKLKKGEKLEIS